MLRQRLGFLWGSSQCGCPVPAAWPHWEETPAFTGPETIKAQWLPCQPTGGNAPGHTRHPLAPPRVFPAGPGGQGPACRPTAVTGRLYPARRVRRCGGYAASWARAAFPAAPAKAESRAFPPPPPPCGLVPSAPCSRVSLSQPRCDAHSTEPPLHMQSPRVRCSPGVPSPASSRRFHGPEAPAREGGCLSRRGPQVGSRVRRVLANNKRPARSPSSCRRPAPAPQSQVPSQTSLEEGAALGRGRPSERVFVGSGERESWESHEREPGHADTRPRRLRVKLLSDAKKDVIIDKRVGRSMEWKLQTQLTTESPGRRGRNRQS